jgi:hypothetical protein
MKLNNNIYEVLNTVLTHGSIQVLATILLLLLLLLKPQFSAYHFKVTRKPFQVCFISYYPLIFNMKEQ